jgi:transcriptional regulator with XRE-family HTH domain
MNQLSLVESLRQELRNDAEYADSYDESFLNAYIATQIKVIREQRGMTQGQLAAYVGTTQGGISRVENVNYSSWNVRTLRKLARAFDVRLKVSFEPYATLPDDVVHFDRYHLERVPRTEDPGLLLNPISIFPEKPQESSVTNLGIWKAIQSTEHKTSTELVQGRFPSVSLLGDVLGGPGGYAACK